MSKVDYTVKVHGDLPAPPPRKDLGRGPGLFDRRLRQIVESVSPDDPKVVLYESAQGSDPSLVDAGYGLYYWYKWIQIGDYVNATAATSSKNVLMQKYGRKGTVLGWEFATVRSAETGNTLLFVKYDPGMIVEGHKELHDAAEAHRKAKNEANRVARENGSVRSVAS